MKRSEIVKTIMEKGCLTCTTLYTMMQKQESASLDCYNKFLKYAIAYEKAKAV